MVLRFSKGGQASDIEIQANEILRLKQTLTQLMADFTGKKFAEVEKHMDRDYFMSADEAKDFGLIDHVVKTRDDIPSAK